jgi:hypothetical protein
MLMARVFGSMVVKGMGSEGTKRNMFNANIRIEIVMVGFWGSAAEPIPVSRSFAGFAERSESGPTECQNQVCGLFLSLADSKWRPFLSLNKTQQSLH